MRAEIVILGGGVIGASVAHHLASRGADVLVLDRGADLGTGSTSRATGGFRVQFDNDTEVRLSLLSREKLLAFEEETGVDSGYRPHGYLFLACSPEELDALRSAQAVQHACGRLFRPTREGRGIMPECPRRRLCSRIFIPPFPPGSNARFQARRMRRCAPGRRSIAAATRWSRRPRARARR
jgi:glycine/D-amino acid oxidase-like deaminating enzyme